MNGKPVTGDSIGGGMLFVGAFSNGLALVSLSQQACMDYRLTSNKDPILVDFASVPAAKRPADCRMQEDVSGRAVIDPETMQVTRIQFHAPHHMIGTEMGWWDVTVEYAPVELDGKMFWLPKSIYESMAVRKASWSYDASYRKYHLMEATSRILPSMRHLRHEPPIFAKTSGRIRLGKPVRTAVKRPWQVQAGLEASSNQMGEVWERGGGEF